MGNETSPTQMMMMRRRMRRRRGWSYLRKCEIPSNTRYTSIYLGIFFSIVSVDFPITLDFLIGKPIFSYVFSLKCHIFSCFFHWNLNFLCGKRIKRSFFPGHLRGLGAQRRPRRTSGDLPAEGAAWHSRGTRAALRGPVRHGRSARKMNWTWPIFSGVFSPA